MKTAIIVLLCACAASANLNVKVNQLLDAEILAVDNVIRAHKINVVKLGDKKAAGYTLKAVTIEDVSTMERKGDAVVKALDDSTIQSTFTYGLENMVLSAASVTGNDITRNNAKYSIKDNALTVSYVIGFDADGKCSFSVKQFEITQLGSVTENSDEAKGLDVSPQFSKVKDFLNQYFASPEFLQNMAKYNPCNVQAKNAFIDVLRNYQ